MPPEALSVCSQADLGVFSRLLGFAGAWAWARKVGEELSRRDFEGGGQFFHGIERGGARSRFDTGDPGPVDAGEVGQSLLGEPLGQPNLTHPLAESLC